MNAELTTLDALVIAASNHLASEQGAISVGVNQTDLHVVVSKEPVFTLAELRGALEQVKVKGSLKEAAELVDMIAGCGDQRGDMMLEYTKQAASEAGRELLKLLGIPVPCNCGRATCVTEMAEGCGHYDDIKQLELNASLESGHEH